VNLAFSKLRRKLSYAVVQALFVIAISTFSPTAAVSGFDEAVASYRTGNYTDAFKEWTEAAQQGDVDAQYNLGCLYVRGEGVPQNRAWAVDWLQRAADQGDVDAATWLLFANSITDERRKEFFSR
jgi:TPR repeat protein